MYTLNKYIKDNIALANSLVIKVNDVARAMNLGVAKTYGIEIPASKYEWKYYLNLAGKKHFSNNDVQITLIETNEKVSYTKEILYQYSYTRLELMKNDKFYKELLSNYPDDILYINGCLYPVDEDTAIAAENGTVLNYNKNFVEENEYSLIKELEEYIKGYFARWHIIEYTITDELYLPGLLATLYASLPNKLQNLRLAKINTAEVHSFHLEMFFKSNLDLWEELTVVKKETLYWLYKNLKYLTKNVGKEKTFNIIIDKIFKENNVGVGEFVIRKPIVNDDDIQQGDVGKSVYQDAIVITETRPLNSVYDLDSSNVNDIKSLADLEMTTDTEITGRLPLELVEHQTRKTEEALKYLNFDNQQTKVLDLNTKKLFEKNGMDVANLIIDIWGKAVSEDVYDTLIDFTDENITSQDNDGDYKTLIDYVEPNSGETFSVSPKVGFLMLIKLLLRASGNEDIPITKITFTTLLNSDKTLFNSLRDNLWDDVYSKTIFDYIEANLPQDLGIIKSPEEMKSYIQDYINYYEMIWLFDSNAENFAVSENIKMLMNRATTYADFYLTDDPNGKHIDEILSEHDTTYDIPYNFDIMLSISSIMEAFTGMKIDKTEQVKSNLKNFIKILNKLTSYTLHNVTGADDNKSINLKYNNLSILRTQNGLITTTNGVLTPLEPNYVKILAKGNDFLEKLTGENFVDVKPDLRMCMGPIEGFMLADYEEDEISVDYIIPSLTTQIRIPYVYDATICDTFQQFISNVNGVLYPLDDSYVGTDAKGNDFEDAQGTNYGVDTTSQIATEKLPYIEGSMYMGEEVVTEPSHSVELTKTLTYDIMDSEFPEEQFITSVDAEIKEPIVNVTLYSTGESNTIDSEIKNDYDDNIYNTSNEVEQIDGVGTYETNEEEIVVDIPDPEITGEVD